MKAWGFLKSGKRLNDYVGLLYISPWIIGFLLFQLYPFLASFIYSFTDLSLKAPNFVGLKNYIYMFTRDDLVWPSLKVTFLYVLMAVPARVAFALIIALILNTKIRFVNFFRTIYYLPSILGASVAISLLWRFIFMREGIVNRLLAYLSIPPVNWLGSPKTALFTISILAVWQYGSSMIVFLAGLKQIPKELYEASRVDGASNIRQFFSITLPMLTPLIFFNLVMQMVNTFQGFTEAFVITNGGPLRATYLFGILLYNNAFLYYKMGYACALSWVLFIILLTLTAMIFKSSTLWVYYEDGDDA